MKNIWLLTKVQLGTALDFNMVNKNRRNSKRSNFIITALLVALMVMLSGCSFLYSYGIGMTLNLVGMLKLLPELMMAVTCVVTIITTIYKVKGTLFGFKDYDITMSLPVKTSEIVASRLLLLYIANIVFTAIIILPADIVYGIMSKSSPVFYLISFLLLFFIPFIPMVAASIIGTIISVVAERFRHSNLVNILIIFTLFTAFMVGSFQMGDSEEKLGQFSADLTKNVDNIYPLAGIYRASVCDGNIGSIAVFILSSLLVFVLFSWLVGMKFKFINSSMLTSFTRSNYKLGQLVKKSAFFALYQKEIKRYFSSTIYVMNTAFGIVMMTIAAVATLFMSKESLAKVLEIPEAVQMLEAFVPIIVCFCVAMTCITASSISLEGKSLWILKSSPLASKTIFYSKIAVNLIMTLTAVFINGIIFIIGLKLSWDRAFILLTMPAAYSFFTAIFGLVVNLKLPNLNWTTEVTVVKQSAATMIAIFTGMILAFLPIGLIFIFNKIDPFLIDGVTTLVITGITLVLYRYLNKEGDRLISSL